VHSAQRGAKTNDFNSNVFLKSGYWYRSTPTSSQCSSSHHKHKSPCPRNTFQHSFNTIKSSSARLIVPTQNGIFWMCHISATSGCVLLNSPKCYLVPIITGIFKPLQTAAWSWNVRTDTCFRNFISAVPLDLLLLC
jgi:hypothetical protein